MSEKYKVANIRSVHFVTITIVDWVDLLIKPVYKHIIIESLKYCQHHKGLNIYAYVIMSSHIHLIISSEEGFTISETIRYRITNVKYVTLHRSAPLRKYGLRYCN